MLLGVESSRLLACLSIVLSRTPSLYIRRLLDLFGFGLRDFSGFSVEYLPLALPQISSNLFSV